MAEELTLDSLNLKKPLEKMTAKELRELAIDKIPQITGASGMDKDELLEAIKEVLGIAEEEYKGTKYKEQILATKRQIKELRAQKTNIPTGHRKERDKLRKQIKQLKRKTRKMAAS